MNNIKSNLQSIKQSLLSNGIVYTSVRIVLELYRIKERSIKNKIRIYDERTEGWYTRKEYFVLMGYDEDVSYSYDRIVFCLKKSIKFRDKRLKNQNIQIRLQDILISILKKQNLKLQKKLDFYKNNKYKYEEKI